MSRGEMRLRHKGAELVNPKALSVRNSIAMGRDEICYNEGDPSGCLEEQKRDRAVAYLEDALCRF
jgi:hypothetical protein